MYRLLTRSVFLAATKMSLNREFQAQEEANDKSVEAENTLELGTSSEVELNRGGRQGTKLELGL